MNRFKLGDILYRDNNQGLNIYLNPHNTLFSADFGDRYFNWFRLEKSDWYTI